MAALTDKDVAMHAAHTAGAVMLKGGTLDQAVRRLVALLQPGDLIFIERRGWFYRQIARTTGSWTSQVGLALRDDEGRWFVYEGGVPLVRRVSLEAFIGRTRGNRFAVRRLVPAPTKAQIPALRRAAEREVGRFNGLRFDFDSCQMFGPKLVRRIYSEALGRKPGKVETLADLRERASPRTLTFWRIWYLGMIPWQRRTMTPHSLYVDPGLETVFESF